jgi:hypothetical protein
MPLHPFGGVGGTASGPTDGMPPGRITRTVTPFLVLKIFFEWAITTNCGADSVWNDRDNSAKVPVENRRFDYVNDAKAAFD